MKHGLAIQIGTSTIRFTPEGRVAVLDAIKALSESKEPELIWKSLKVKHPGLSDICTEQRLDESRATPVVDISGWGKIEEALLDYVLEHECWC